MRKIKPPSPEIQTKALATVQSTYERFNELLQWYRTLWLELFRATYIFETDRNAKGQSTIFFPKCFEQIEKIAPRLTGNNPKFVIGLNVPINANDPTADMLQYQEVNQASLNYFWKLGNSQAKLRSWAKSGLVNGIAWATVDFVQKTLKTEKVENTVNEAGEEIEKTTQTEQLLMEYPIFTPEDIFDIYFDPRIEFVDDMRAIIRRKEKVRKTNILNMKEKYFNLEEVENMHAVSSDDGKKQSKFNIQGVPDYDDKYEDGYITLTEYYGYFSETGECEDEELYKITTVDNSVVIGYERIKFLPFEKFVPIEIPGQGVGKGVVEPIKKLQDAYNLTRNQRFENVSLVLNRMWLMKIGAGIDPRKLVSRAGNIIPVKDPDGLIPVPTPDITGSSFNESQSINTEIQTTLGTIDTTQDAGENGFTNLATGQKIRWNEYNTRFKAIRENLEEALERLGQKMLMMVAERAKQNPLIQDEQTKKFYEVAKEAFDSFSDFYKVTVLADSTSIDSIENKRDDVLAFGQLAIAYKGQNVPINMDKVWQDIVESFPGRNPSDYLMPPEMQAQAQGGQPQGQGRPLSNAVMQQAQVQPSPEDQLNQSLTNV